MKIRFELTGEMPLLMHQDDVEQADELDAWRKDPEHSEQSKRGDDRSPPWSWMTYLYSDGEYVAMPGDNLKRCLRDGATKITIPGAKGKSYKEVSQSGILMMDEYLDFRCGPKNGRVKMADILKLRDKTFREQSAAVLPLGFRLHVKRASVGQSKHVRVRPRFEQWTVAGELEVVSEALTLDLVKKFFDLSGRAGLCDWRPSSKKSPGVFGMFTSKLTRVK